MANVEILGGPNRLRAVIQGQLFDIADELFLIFKPEILLASREIIKERLNNSPTILSLLGGDFGINNLKIQFGLTDENAVSSVDSIIDAVVDSVDINLVIGKLGNKELGRLDIIIAPESFQESLGRRLGVYISEPSGSEIPWLDWLLTKGMTIVVDDFKLVLKNSPFSRSGGGVMKEEEGAFYRVDSTHAGTIGENFITKAVQESIPDIIKIINQLVRQI